MAENASKDNTIKVWPPIVWLCRWIWQKRTFLIGLDIVSGILSGLPLLDLTTVPNLLGLHILAWIATNWPFFLVLFLVLLLLTITCGLVARLDAPLSARQLQRNYLSKLINDTQKSTVKGIPAEPSLMTESVDLAEIFIPLQFRHNRPHVDYPLSPQELERYRQEQKNNIFSHELQRVMFAAEKNWWHDIKLTDRITIADLWKLLNSSNAIVIQGYPGTGKSTLMERLTLYMALRLSGQQDTQMPAQQFITPLLLPILLRLNKYAEALEQTTNLTLYDYMRQTWKEMQIPGLVAFMQNKLARGSCLVILDGLDEVSKPKIREQVQEAIRDCIRDHRGEQAANDPTKQQNRFLITSRVAGYDQAAFPDYPHVTIAELSREQIQDFLPRWCRATLCRDRSITVQAGMHDANIEREVTKRVQIMRTALSENAAIKELAENPLLLTLLVVMQQNDKVLPQQRFELYDLVTRTLLEARNKGKKLDVIPPITALKRLGPLAFAMQAENNNFAREADVMTALVDVIKQDEGGSDEAINTEATEFLKLIRERGGLFVQRSGDYFGFMHRTFQEYFAARYILNNIKVDEAHWINELVTRASRLNAAGTDLDNLWREPFLLAVAYQSSENELIADKILLAFLALTPANPLPQHIAHLLLATNAVIEAKLGTLKADLKKQIATQLLTAYEQAQHEQEFEQCEEIELVMHRWLLSLPKEGYRLPLLEIISHAICDAQHMTSQRAALTLFAMIADKVEPCSSAVFETLIPPLLALTGLSAVEPYHPTNNLMPARDVDVADLALTTLSFLGKSGPAGLSVSVVRQYFQDHPDHLRLLARCSLEADILNYCHCHTVVTSKLSILPSCN